MIPAVLHDSRRFVICRPAQPLEAVRCNLLVLPRRASIIMEWNKGNYQAPLHDIGSVAGDGGLLSPAGGDWRHRERHMASLRGYT